MDSSADFAIPLDQPASAVIAGGGKITAKHVADLMDDWIRFGTLDQADLRVWLPGDQEYHSHVVTGAASWAAKDGRPGNSVVIKVEQSADQVVWPTGDTAWTVAAEETGTDVATTLIMALEEDNREEQRAVYLILAWGEGDTPPDAFTGQLLAAARQAGITVLEISAKGLEMMPEPDEEPIVEPEEATVSETEKVAEPDEAQTITPPAAPAGTYQAIDPEQLFIIDTLKRCEFLVRAEMYREGALTGRAADRPDLLDAIENCQEHLRNRGLGAVLDEAVNDNTPRVEVTTITPEPEPARKGKPRAGDGQVLVYLSPDGVKALDKGFAPGIGEITLGRGKPRAGWVRRHLDRSEVPAGLLKDAT